MKSHIKYFLINHTPSNMKSDMDFIFEWILSKRDAHEKCDVLDVKKISPLYYHDILSILEKYEVILGYYDDAVDFVTHSLVWMINNPKKNCIFRKLLESGYLKIDDDDIKIFNVIRPLYYYDYDAITIVVYLNYHGYSYKESEEDMYVNYLNMDGNNIRSHWMEYDDLIFDLDTYISPKHKNKI